jgi:hypothetical protein
MPFIALLPIQKFALLMSVCEEGARYLQIRIYTYGNMKPNQENFLHHAALEDEANLPRL